MKNKYMIVIVILSVCVIVLASLLIFRRGNNCASCNKYVDKRMSCRYEATKEEKKNDIDGNDLVEIEPDFTTENITNDDGTTDTLIRYKLYDLDYTNYYSSDTGCDSFISFYKYKNLLFVFSADGCTKASESIAIYSVDEKTQETTYLFKLNGSIKKISNDTLYYIENELSGPIDDLEVVSTYEKELKINKYIN